MPLTQLKPLNLDTTANYSFGTVTVTGNIAAGNLLTNNLRYANGTPYVFSSNAAGANTQVQFNNANAFAGSANFTFATSTNTLSVTNIIANGSGLTSLTGANVTGTVPNATAATTAGTVTTAAQPNITSVGLLTELSIGPNSSLIMTGTSGFIRANTIQGTDGVVALTTRFNGITGAVGILSNLTVGTGAAGNISANGNVTASFFVSNIATGTAPLTVTSTTRVSNLNVAQANVADFISITTATSGNAFLLFANAVTGNISETANAVFVANSSNGAIHATTFVGALSGAATTAGTVTTAAQPNITSVGSLTSLTVTGNITTGNISTSGSGGNLSGANFVIANFFTGTLTTAAQPNITSVGTLGNLTSNGTINFTGASNVSLGAVGNLKITGGTSGQVLSTDGTGNLSWGAGGGGGGAAQPGTDFNTTISGVNNYAVTNVMANGAVFGSNVIVYSVYLTNIDTTGSNGATLSANFRYANGTSIVLNNQIPIPFRGAVELLKQPKYFANGDALQFQAFNNAVAANNFIHASITFQSVTDTSYRYAVANLTVATPVDVYTSTGNASVVQSVMITNSGSLGNIPVTTTIVNSSNVIQGYLTSGLLVPLNSTIELCEQPRRLNAGDKIQVTSGFANTISTTVSARII
jgi:hypothetical protein